LHPEWEHTASGASSPDRDRQSVESSPLALENGRPLSSARPGAHHRQRGCAAAETDLEQNRTSTEDVRNVAEFSLALPLLLGSDEEAAEAVAASRDVDIGVLDRIRISLTNRQDRYDRLLDPLWANRDRAGADQQWIFYSLDAQGALDRAARVADSLDLQVSIRGLGAGWMLGKWSTAGVAGLTPHARPSACERPALSTQCLLFVGWGLARSGEVGGARETLGKIRRWAAEAEGPTAEIQTSFGDAVEGTIAAEEARVADARRLLSPVAAGTGNQKPLARTALAAVELAKENVAETIHHHSEHLSNYGRSQALLELARIHDDRGDSDQARPYYRSLLTITQEGDQDLPEIVEANEALKRLEGRGENTGSAGKAEGRTHLLRVSGRCPLSTREPSRRAGCRLGELRRWIRCGACWESDRRIRRLSAWAAG
jgi:hypothetical protein